METVESDRLFMRRLMPDDYKTMAAWDMDERVCIGVMTARTVRIIGRGRPDYNNRWGN